MSRLRQAVFVLMGIDRESSVRLLARIPDSVVAILGRELLALDPGAVRSTDLELAMRALLRELNDGESSQSKRKKMRQAKRPRPAASTIQTLTSQECEVLGRVLCNEKIDISALVLRGLPTPVTTRIILTMRKDMRSSILVRYKSLWNTPEDLLARVISDFIEKVPPRPFPALAARLEAVVQTAAH